MYAELEKIKSQRAGRLEEAGGGWRRLGEAGGGLRCGWGRLEEAGGVAGGEPKEKVR